jgi:hypothetical protein
MLHHIWTTQNRGQTDIKAWSSFLTQSERGSKHSRTGKYTKRSSTAQVRHNACVKEKERTPKDALSLFITNR